MQVNKSFLRLKFIEKRRKLYPKKILQKLPAAQPKSKTLEILLYETKFKR